MKNVIRVNTALTLLALLALLTLTGCANSLFYWGKYEESLIERYIENNPAHTENYLHELITEAEVNNQRIPPGVCADYGFSLYQRGDKNGAVRFFEKEKNLYPESSLFMTKLIDKIIQKTNSQSKEKSQ